MCCPPTWLRRYWLSAWEGALVRSPKASTPRRQPLRRRRAGTVRGETSTRLRPPMITLRARSVRGNSRRCTTRRMWQATGRERESLPPRRRRCAARRAWVSSSRPRRTRRLRPMWLPVGSRAAAPTASCRSIRRSRQHLRGRRQDELQRPGAPLWSDADASAGRKEDFRSGTGRFLPRIEHRGVGRWREQPCRHEHGTRQQALPRRQPRSRIPRSRRASTWQRTKIRTSTGSRPLGLSHRQHRPRSRVIRPSPPWSRPRPLQPPLAPTLPWQCVAASPTLGAPSVAG